MAVNGNLINFYLASDEALDRWRLNQIAFKPEHFSEFAGQDHAYKYFPGNPWGEKLFLTFILSPNRKLEQMEEALAYASKSSTLAAGAEGNANGEITSKVDQSNFGYQAEHSAFWVFRLQQLKTAYESLMDKLRVERTSDE